MSRKMLTKLLSFLLVLVLVFNFYPCSAAAMDIGEESDDEPKQTANNDTEWFVETKDEEQLQEELAEGVCEIKALREENVKHFKLEDGTYQAVVYAQPVHRLNANGEWVDIDNSLSIVGDEISTSNARIKFAKKITGNGTVFTLHDGNYKVTLGLPGATKKVEGKYFNTEARDETDISVIPKYTMLANLSAKVVYENILDGIDLEYVLDANDIKENIIIKEKQANYDYTFSLELNGLDAQLDNNSVFLYNKNGEAVYKIPVPYMYDATGETSWDVCCALNEVGNGKYELILSAEPGWINADERMFPVVADPSLVDIAQVADTYVYASTPTTNYGQTTDLWVLDSAEAYYKFTTPVLPEGIIVRYAHVNIPYYYNVENNKYMSMGIYQITEDWSEHSVTWNTRPSTAAMPLNTKNLYADGANASAPEYITYDVSSYVSSWYSGTPNYGFALKREGGTNTSVLLVAKEKVKKYAQLIIDYEERILAGGVYAIGCLGGDKYLKSDAPSTIAWLLQDTSHSSAPTDAQDLENLFKISYRPEHEDYIIRSMLDNSIVIYPNTVHSAPIAERLSLSDAELPASYGWKLIDNISTYQITYTEGGTTYYLTSLSEGDGERLRLTTSGAASGTRWFFVNYMGNAIERVAIENRTSFINTGATYEYKAYVQSTRINHNGPVIYAVKTSGGMPTNIAAIDTTGKLTTSGMGKVRVEFTYSGAPWIWYQYVTIGGNIIEGVPTNLRSTAAHECIPCAITNVAAFWCNNGYPGFACGTASEQETKAVAVQAKMDTVAGGHTANNNINDGFEVFTYNEGFFRYTLVATTYWNEAFDWNDIVAEIDAGRPVFLGFAPLGGSEYDRAHMTVCVGYEIEGGVQYVYVSDAHTHDTPGYFKTRFNTVYNDFMATVTVLEVYE